MGDEYEAAQDMNGNPIGSYQADPFDVAGDVNNAGDGHDPKAYYERILASLRDDASRPDARRGRYYLPNPVSGKTASWQRVTNFVKLTDDMYHLELWKQRNIVKGLATMFGAPTEYGFRTGVSETLDHVAGLHVKVDKERLNNIATKAQNVADAYKMADEGTILHLATEVADFMGGDTSLILREHLARVRLYLDALALNGMVVAPDMIERVVSSSRYEVAGKFDRIYRLADGSYVIGDLKTGDSLDLSFPSIAAQLDCYRDGINSVGIFDGQRYDNRIRVRNDFGIVVHLPSTRNEVTVHAVNLAQGGIINAGNLIVRDTRKIKAQHVASVFDQVGFGVVGQSQDYLDLYWLEAMNAAATRQDLVGVAERARCFGQWNERLAGQARIIASELA